MQKHLRALVTLMITSAHFRSLVLDLGDVFQSCIAEIVNTGAAEQRRFRTGDLSSNSSTATSDDEGPHPQNMDSSATLKVPSPIFESAEEEYVEEEDVEDEDEVFYEAPATLEKNPHYGDLQSEVSTLVNSSANTSPNKKTKPQQKQRLQVPPLSLDTSQVIAAAAEGSGSARKESNLDSVPSTIISRRSTRSERSKRSNRSILSLTAIFKSNRTSLDDTELDTKLHDVVAEIRGHRKFREPVAGLVKFGERHVRRRKVQLEKMRSAEVDKDLRRAAENYKLLAERVTNTPWDHLLSIAARLRESPAFPSLSTAIRTTIDVDSVSSPALSPNPQSVHDSRPIVNAVRQIMDDPDGKEFAREMHRIVTGLRKDETRKEVAMWIDRLWTAVLGKGTWSSRHHHITKLHQDVRRVLIPQLFIRYQYIPIPPFTIYSNGLEIQLLDPIVISMANILPDDIHCGLRWRRDPQFAPVLGSSKGRMEIDVKVHGMQFNFDSVRVLVRPAAATEKNAKNKKKGTPTIRMPKIPWNWSGSVDGMLGGPGMSFALFYSPPTSSQPPLLQCRAIIPQRNAKFSLHGMFGPLIGPLIRKRVCLAAEREIERKVGGVLGTVLGGLAKA
ncbi:hypothetical protein DFS34DRAFT_133076 [Phlyctochytrium arcticum]|nr:hypothetical protein DFS34DRAFT_133076 [Phlyctochytrium arcticum]